MSEEFTYTIGAIEKGAETRAFWHRSTTTHSTIDAAQTQSDIDIMATKRGWELFLPWQRMKAPGAPGWWYNEPINTPEGLAMVVIAHPTSATQPEVDAVIDAFLAERA